MNPIITGNVEVGSHVQLAEFTELVAKGDSIIRLCGYNGIFPFVRIMAEDSKNQIIIGSNTRIQRRTEVHGDVKIGENTIIGPDVFISSGSHLFDFISELTINEQDILFASINAGSPSNPVNIGNDVWIGRLVTIMPGVNIGNRSIIGANSVVTRNVECGEVWAGSPARFLRHRDLAQTRDPGERNSTFTRSSFCTNEPR